MYKIHVGFGFHVNCYHSYRGDSNDNLGFGSDIRIIRKILDTLTDFNERGIPVKGTWDSENFFSLEKILPEYAPDIIEKMKMRTERYADEQIIMGYSNGALGAMNSEELKYSVEKAVSNENGSGLCDLFGKCEMIVRPQEVMFSPSQVSTYKKLGVKALCLYYSCVPFDAFRTLVPRLPDELAFNPLTYTYKGDSITVIPTYNNSDICDAGCLRAWVKELHSEQLSGKINHDLFIFVNMDADAIFWETMNLPLVGSKIANTDGIHGLVNEIADLDFVEFDTPGGYLKNHEPLGKIDFTQDTADGNFTGYASWGEKPYNRKIWTAIERSRMMSKVNCDCDSECPSFLDRILLLSTTHFGLATPVLNIQREKKADELALSVTEKERNALPRENRLTVYNTAKSDFMSVQLKVNFPVSDVSEIVIKNEYLKDYAVIWADKEKRSIFALLRFSEILDKYTLEVEKGIKEKKPALRSLKTESLEIRFTSTGTLYEVLCNGKTIGNHTFLQSFITYDGKKYVFRNDGVKPLSCGGSGEGLRLSGEIHLPGETEKGEFEYDFFTVKSCRGIFIRAYVKYPSTPERDSISTENSSLGRFSDMKWQETGMLTVTPKLHGENIRVIKRNFEGDISEFRTMSFPESDSENAVLDSFNHQLTGGLVGLRDEEKGIIIANARQVLCSMAHCPMRLNSDKSVNMNIFGHFYGKQRHHFSRANGEILDTYTLVTPQGKSIAPSYNGCSETSFLGLFGFTGEKPNEKDMSDIISFADGAVANAPENSMLLPFTDDNVKVKAASMNSVSEKSLKNPVLTGISGNLGKYITKGSRAVLHIVKSQINSK